MKFYQLNIGERFSYQGETYIKASPVLASNEATGEQCFMRRADSVQSVATEEIQKPAYDKKAMTDARQLLTRIDTFVETSVSAIQHSVNDLTTQQKQAIAEVLRRQGEELKKGIRRYKK